MVTNNVPIGNSPAYIYSLTRFAFLEHQTSGFYHTTEANLVPLLIFIARIHIASFTSMFCSLTTRLVFDILFIKLEFYCAHTCKKNNTHLAFMYYPNGKEMDQMVRNVIAYHLKELLFGTYTLNFNCLLDDFNCAFKQIRCLSVLLDKGQKITQYTKS